MSRLITSCKLLLNVYGPTTSKSLVCFMLNAGCSKHTLAHAAKDYSTDQPYDIAIVGGGMVGLSLACSLASNPLTQKLRVAIIDSNPALANGICIKDSEPPDPRVSTVTPSSIALLRDVGAWKFVEQHRHAYFDKMQVWDYTGLGYTRYTAKDVDKEALGCVVENKVIHSSLMSCLEEYDIRKTLFLSRLTSMTLDSRREMSHPSSKPDLSTRRDMAKLELDDGTILLTKLVVGADGGKSRVRELAGFGVMGWNYLQNAVICTVEFTEESRCAWQRFLPAGPIALLPLGDKFCNIVWTSSPKESLAYKTMNDDNFVQAVNYVMDFGYGSHPEVGKHRNGMFRWSRSDVMTSNDCFEVPPKVVKLVSQRMLFPLSLMHAKDYASKRVVLIGDAAHTVHPLAGQGVNLGFQDASSLSRVIIEGVALGADIGEVSLLRKYESDRKLANITMASILDGFQKAYSLDFGPLNALRAAAFGGAQNLSFLKKEIILYASGEKKLPIFS